ncbi:MAG TPA: M14 family zinc carboxypeptidase [Thermoanaerobaculia bacterium]
MLFLVVPLEAQEAVRSPQEFLGYEIGERFTPHHRILGYFEELDSRSPRVVLERIGETWEHRPLLLAVITSEANHAAAESIRQSVATLARGDGDPDALVRTTPVVVWLGFGVHGNESSSSEAALLVAHSLLTDPKHAALLDRVVVIIDPVQNPDGRERYTDWFRRTRGVKANPDPAAFEHQEPWPGGRYNHYLNDMNRDWAWQSQPETRARVAAYRRWNPQVVVDLHEMSYQSTYFFPPSARPLNANLPKELDHWLGVFGRANAEVFSDRRWPFFVGEHFDLFYPAYGDSWPSLRGAVGMTYEMAGGGRAGTAVERRDGTILTLADRAERHQAAALATVRTAAEHREGLLRQSRASARNHIESGRNAFLILPDSPNFEALIAMLERQGIVVERLTSPVTVRASRVDREATVSRAFPVGTAVVSTRQPLGGLVKTMLERAPLLEGSFLEEQRARTDVDEDDEFYDVTAWSLPIAMNVEAWVAALPVTTSASAPAVAALPFQAGRYGYVVDGLDPAAHRLAGRLLAEEVNFSVARTVLRQEEGSFSRGSLVILKGNNPEDLDARLERAAAATRAALIPLGSGWAEGSGFGSDNLRHVINPRIGLVGGAGSSPLSFGMLWFTLDVDTPVPHTVINADSLRNVTLNDFRVLVFPDGGYAERLGTPGIERIRNWVREGGTVVAVKGGSAFMRTKDLELTKLEPWKPAAAAEGAQPREERYNDFRVPGSAFRTVMNERSWLTFGVPRAPAALIIGSGAFVPLARKADQIVTIETKEPVLAGVAWKESIDRLQGSPYLTSEPFGRGRVITFADEPHFRNMWRGTLPLLLNAVLYSPSFTQ